MRKQSARMTAVPQLNIPEIMVENDLSDDGTGGAAPRSPLSPASRPSSVDAGEPRNWLGSVDLSLHDTSWIQLFIKQDTPYGPVISQTGRRRGRALANHLSSARTVFSYL